MPLLPEFYIMAEKKPALWIRQAALATCGAISPLLPQGGPWACSLKISGDRDVQSLNKQFRGQDKPTNVLSFPGGDDAPHPNEPFYLGDIIFAEETLKKEAKTQEKTFENHLKHLTIHGLLHLYGYDHLTEEEALVMEALEIYILKMLNIKNPYEKP